MSSGSILFQPFRSLGLISSHARPHLKLLGQERFLTTALGKSWAVYNLDKLRVVLMGGAREQVIRAIVSFRDITFTTCGNEIIVWRRQDEVYRIDHHQSPVYLLYLFGSTLISVDESQLMCVWDIKSLTPATSVRSLVSRSIGGESFIDSKGTKMSEEWHPTPLSTIQFPQTSKISCVLHPSTYLNKIVVGFGGSVSNSSAAVGGGLELWNIKTRSLVYRFKTQSWNMDQHNPERMLDLTLGRNKRNLDGSNTNAVEQISVSCIEQSPAVDVVAVGLSNGLVLLLNLQTDQLLHAYVHSTPGSAAKGAPISSVSFRTDNNQNHLATTAQNDPNICIWDLEKKQLKTVIKDAHGIGGSNVSDAVAARSAIAVDTTSTTIHSVVFLPNEPLLITVGTDNALKQWIFDSADGTGRLLKDRSGHSQPPTKIRFHPGGERGILDILSASADRSLRSFSLQKEEQSKELSQGSVEKRSKAFGSEAKLTPIADLDVCAVREKEWSSILTAHQGDAAGYTWKWSSKALSQHKLLNTTPGTNASVVKSVLISACGNFGFLGHANGRIDSFHMQSGTFKATYGSNHLPDDGRPQPNASFVTKDLQSKNINIKRKAAKEAAAQAANGTAPTSSAPMPPQNLGHTSSVTGLAVDGLNKQLVSCSLDGSIIFWDFRRRNVLARLQLDSPISKMAYSKENDLLAVMTDNLVLHVIDAMTHTTVRRFMQHTSPLTDLVFSGDARWLLTSSTDCCVRVFDLPSSTMVDFLKFSRPVSSMAMSPNCDFLATTHVGNLAIHLWANKDYFGSASSINLSDARKNRIVSRGRPLEMEVRERQDGMEEENQEEEERIKVKQEHIDEDEEDDDDDEDEDDSDDDADGASTAASNKRRRLSLAKLSASAGGLPFLGISESEQFSLITYSTVPRSKWQTLAHLEEIKLRNKATEVVSAPKDAPFFLTALSSLSNEKDGASIREKAALADAFGVSAAGPTKPTLGARTVKSGGTTLETGIIPIIKQAKVQLAKIVTQTQDKQNLKVVLAQACQ